MIEQSLWQQSQARLSFYEFLSSTLNHVAYIFLMYRGETPRIPRFSMANCLQKSQILEAYISKLAYGIFKVRASKVAEKCNLL